MPVRPKHLTAGLFVPHILMGCCVHVFAAACTGKSYTSAESQIVLLKNFKMFAFNIPHSELVKSEIMLLNTECGFFVRLYSVSVHGASSVW